MTTTWKLGAIALLLTPAVLLVEVTIDDLVAETGIEVAAEPIRSAPRWQAPRAVIVRGSDDYAAGIGDGMSGVRLMPATTYDEALALAPEADAIIGFCNPELVRAAPRASWIQIFSSGAERCLDAPEVASGEIVLTNMQKMSSPVIGEHAIAMMLSLTRGLIQLAKQMPAGEWDRALTVAPVGRGQSTDTDALVAALEDGQIGGAGLDVTDPEPLPADHPLWQMDNVIISPHVAAYGGSSDRHRTLVRENLERFIAGEPLYNVVDPGQGY